MKPKSIKSLLALALLAPGALFAQTTAKTTPVGYVTMNVTGGGSPASPAFSYIGPSLPKSASFSGLSLGTGTVATVDFAGTPFASLTFGLSAAPLSEPLYYAQVVTGPNAGQWSDIISNTSSSITCSDAIAANFATQTIVIRQHHTVGSLFGTAEADVLLLKGLTISGADELSVLDSATQLSSTYYYSLDDADEDGFADGWVTSGGVPSASKVISPMDGITVKRKAAGAVAITQSGDVNPVSPKVLIAPGANILPLNRALGQSMRLGPLTAALASDGRTGSNLIGSGLTSALTISTADEVTLLVAGVPVTYYFSLDDADEDGFADGWVTSGGTPSADVIITEGSGLKINRKSSPALLWNIPAEPIDQNPIVGVGN
jgi:hypothetical protein